MSKIVFRKSGFIYMVNRSKKGLPSIIKKKGKCYWMLGDVKLKQFWVRICVTLEIRVACKKLALEAFIYFYSSSIHGKIDINIHDIQQFITGTPSLPCLGFQKMLEVNFVHDCQKPWEKECSCKPTASMCDLSLNLPIHINQSQKCHTQWQKQFVCLMDLEKFKD